MIQMTKPPNRRLATGASRRADAAREIARQCPTAAATRFSAPSTRRAERIARRTIAARARREAPACAASHLARRQVPAARRASASRWTGRTNPQIQPPPPQPPPREPPERSGDPSTEIATELGLGAALTLDQLDVPLARFCLAQSSRSPARRRPERANARVAIANTLYDRARRESRQGALAIDRPAVRPKMTRKSRRKKHSVPTNRGDLMLRP